MSDPLTAERWDAEYRTGRYVDEPPLAFVDTILAVLATRPAARAGAGLYVGCGNGRNYLPLVDGGLTLWASTQAVAGVAYAFLWSPSAGPGGCLICRSVFHFVLPVVLSSATTYW